jgi:imidazolonepropionase-like amidohydrolase
MRSRVVLACCAALLPHLAALAAPRITLLKAARIVDVRAGAYKTDQALLIEGERIKEVGPLATIQAHAPADAVVIDLGGATLLPGLIDCHAHLLSGVQGRNSVADSMLLQVVGMTASTRALLGAAHARETLEAGITTVRNIGHSGVDGDAALRDAIDAGWVPGPRMLAATRKLTPPGGQGFHLRHEVAPEIVDLEFLPVTGTEAARRAVREALASGADVIKVVVDDGPRVLTPEEMRAIVREARRSKAKVAAHATTAPGIQAAIDAEADSIEHADAATDEMLKEMAKKGLFLGATDWPAQLMADVFVKTRVLAPGQAAGFEAYIKELTEKNAKRMAQARRSGVRFVMASDMWAEAPGRTRGQAAVAVLEGLQAEGVPPSEILKAATLNGAELIGWADRVGVLEPDTLADVIAVDGDPLKEVKDLQRVRFVMKGGSVVRRE